MPARLLPANSVPSGLRSVLAYREDARTDLLDFMRYVWWMPTRFIIGFHTRMVAARISRAIEDFKRGRSTFLCISLPFRHGKSDMVSRALPPFFLGTCAHLEPDVICTGYGADLVHKFSRAAKRIITTPAYNALFPDVRLSFDKRTDSLWKADIRRGDAWASSGGDVTVTGLGGSLTGSGYHLGIVDDFCKSRQEAESDTYRDRVWDSFANDFMTRRAPTSITIVTATTWHVDDLIGRIRKQQKNNAEFPAFEFITFPARGPAQYGGECIEYDTEYLFEERFTPAWYREQYATLGLYNSAGLLDCSPCVTEGALFNITRVTVHDDINDFPATRYVRAWDLASTEKELIKDDPDFTAGSLVGVTREKGDGGFVPHIWIKDLMHGQWAAPHRDEMIKATAARDGAGVRVLIESLGGYKDAVTTLQKILRGVRHVEGVNVSGDKVVKASPMEPVFEAGHAHIVHAAWNDIFFKHFREFPWGDHDDVVDAVAIAYNHLDTNPLEMPFDRRIIGA